MVSDVAQHHFSFFVGTLSMQELSPKTFIGVLSFSFFSGFCRFFPPLPLDLFPCYCF